MIFNIYWPIIEFFGFWAIRGFFRSFDNRFSLDPDKTNTKTIYQYVELYSGPAYLIHYKYSFILNVVFVTFMYGLSLPILFPIAACSLIVLYVVEKAMIYYSYRQPPTYDSELNDSVISLMTLAPLFFFSFGYWMLSNKQLFSNEVIWKKTLTEPEGTNHIWTEVFSGKAYSVDNQGFPMIICFWLYLILLLLKDRLFSLVVTMFKSLKVGNFELDEDLDNYFETLDKGDKEWSAKEEEHCRKVLKFATLEEETFRKFRETEQKDMQLQGVHTYEILANPHYLDAFQYLSPAFEDRANYIVDDDDDEGNDEAQSDLVKIFLNLAFLEEGKAKQFKFDKESYRRHLDNA